MAIDSPSKDVVAFTTHPVHNPHICGTGESLPRPHVEEPLVEANPFEDAAKEIVIGSVRTQCLFGYVVVLRACAGRWNGIRGGRIPV